jgi:hypothetical protein
VLPREVLLDPGQIPQRPAQPRHRRRRFRMATWLKLDLDLISCV